MVALKPPIGGRGPPEQGLKQERRGGIETPPTGPGPTGPPGSRNAVVALKLFSAAPRISSQDGKQERRGGIETRAGGDPAGGGPGGSRNAVVALKRQLLGDPLRRVVGSRNAVVALKRGSRFGSSKARPPEAGTPWWH